MQARKEEGGGRWPWLLPLVAAAATLRPATAAGLFFPDIDQAFLSVLGHRSAVTHSIVLPLLALALAPGLLARLPARIGPQVRSAAERSVEWSIAWFLLGVAIHLMADVAPLGCRGYALAKLPAIPLLAHPASLPCGVSLLWYAGNAVAGLALCEWLLRREGNVVTWARHAASGVVLAVYVLAHEQRPALLPVLALAWAAAASAARAAALAMERRTGLRR